VLPRERILEMLKKVNVEAILSVVPHGTPQQVARTLKGFVDAGLRVCKILDYGGMAGLKYAARSAQKVRDAEDEIARLVG
jgi:phthiodiolone/phenolphthiodiolone dimycocerosates ketoreductase